MYLSDYLIVNIQFITMPYKQTDYLVKLVSRLSPAEKRQFRIFSNRNNPKGDILYMKLFDYLDKTKQYNEEQLLQKIPSIKKGQLSNLKSNLYKQILNSLRQQYKNSRLDFTIREYIDYAVLLHGKGMYHASLDTLDRAKKLAMEANKYSSVLTILELEKQIEGLYITGSMYPKAKELRKETQNILSLLNTNHQLSNLSLSLYGIYLQYGYVKDNRDYDYVTDYFRDRLPLVHMESMDFYGKLYYYQSHVWYYNMVQDFANNYKYAQKWLDLFEDSSWRQKERTQYIKGLHNVLNALFMAQRYDKFQRIYDELIKFGESELDKMNRDELSVFRLIEYTHGINQFFLKGNFEEGVNYVKNIEISLKENTFDWDLNRILLFNYKIASIYFCYGDLNHTITLLNRITNEVYPNFREDIQCFARILNLIAHFDLGNETLVNHQIRSTFRFLSRMEHMQNALKEILQFLRRIPKISEEDIREEFGKLKTRLSKIEEQRFERRPFLYLDIISWLESKIEDVPVKMIIQRKIRARME